MSVIACMSSRFHVTPTLTHLHLASIVTVYSVLLLFVPTYISSKCILYHFICSFELKTVNKQELPALDFNKGSSFNISASVICRNPTRLAQLTHKLPHKDPFMRILVKTTKLAKVSNLLWSSDLFYQSWLILKSSKTNFHKKLNTQTHQKTTQKYKKFYFQPNQIPCM